MTISYSFEHNVMTNLNGKKVKESKSIVDGDKGVTVRFLSKTDSDFRRVKAMEKDGKFTVSTKKGEEEEKVTEMSEKEFLDMAKKDKDLDFVVEYMKKRIRGGAKRTVRKSSKKGSKSGGVRRVRKSSKKSSKKTSRK
jgi:hypothetical protein